MIDFFEKVVHVIIIGGITGGCFMALILLNQKPGNRANTFLSVLLVAMSFSITHILYAERVLSSIADRVYNFGDPTFLLIAPLLWFYANALIDQRLQLRWRDLFHFGPFLLVIVCSLSFRSIESEQFRSFIDHYNQSIYIAFWVGVIVQFSVYLYQIHMITGRHHLRMKQEVSNTEGFDIDWVWYFMIVFSIINVLFIFALYTIIHWKNSSWPSEGTALIFSLSIFALGYKAVSQEVISDSEVEQELDNNESLPNQNQISKVLDYMDSNRPFLDQELTLTDLANQLTISRSDLSHLINKGLASNFYDFVNKYRVEEVKRLMTDKRKAHYSLLGMALEAGFKSKSTFNLIFKRFTGLTPTEYRRNLKK